MLAGDYCYAHGLVRITGAGDLFVVEALADLIALGAGLVASDAHAALVPLWRGTTAAIAARRGPREAETGARFLAAQRALRADGDTSGLEALADELPPTPGLEEALAAMKDLREWISELEKAGELRRITAPGGSRTWRSPRSPTGSRRPAARRCCSRTWPAAACRC